MAEGERQHIPITTEDAVAAVRNGAWLVWAEIPDFRALLIKIASAIDRHGEPAALHCVACRILNCECYELEIFNPIDLSLPSRYWNDPKWSTTFVQKADFIRAMFMRAAKLRRATFMRDAYFLGATFTQVVDFLHTKFSLCANFGGAKFRQDTSFRYATFMGDTNFGWTVIGQAVDFEGTEFCGNASLNLNRIQTRPATEIRMDIEQIGNYQRPKWLEGRLPTWFKRRWPSVHRIRDETSGDHEKLASVAAQYNMLRNNFRKLPSAETEEDRCHYKYKDLTRRAMKARILGPNWWWKLWDWAVLKWMLGYCIYTKRIVFTALSVIALCAGLFATFGSKKTFLHYGEAPFNALYFSCATFTTLDYGEFTPIGWMSYVCAAEAILGVVLTAIFTVSWARKMIR